MKHKYMKAFVPWNTIDKGLELSSYVFALLALLAILPHLIRLQVKETWMWDMRYAVVNRRAYLHKLELCQSMYHQTYRLYALILLPGRSLADKCKSMYSQVREDPFLQHLHEMVFLVVYSCELQRKDKISFSQNGQNISGKKINLYPFWKVTNEEKSFNKNNILICFKKLVLEVIV